MMEKLRPAGCAGEPLAARPRIDLHRRGTYYGGYWVDEAKLGPASVVYSIGLGEDISFEESLLSVHGLSVYGFDPTPRSVRYVKRRLRKRRNNNAKRGKLVHTAEGVGTKAGRVTFARIHNEGGVSMHAIPQSTTSSPRQGANRTVSVPINTLPSWMARFGHTSIDVLKMDVEAFEYDVLLQLLDEASYKAVPPPFRQLLIELHPTLLSPPDRHKHAMLLRSLRESGFVVAGVEGGMRDYVSRARAALWGCHDVRAASRFQTVWSFVRL